MKFSHSIQLGMTKGNNGINYMEEQDAIGVLHQLEEQLIWNEIISLNAIENERNYGIAIDLE